jgi:hypothetical protein
MLCIEIGQVALNYLEVKSSSQKLNPNVILVAAAPFQYLILGRWNLLFAVCIKADDDQRP